MASLYIGCVIIIPFACFGICLTETMIHYNDIFIGNSTPGLIKFPDHRPRVLNWTLGIEDNLTRFLVSQYMINCPNRHMCYDNREFYTNYSLPLTSLTTSQVCRCENDCFRKLDCCPTKYIESNNTSKQVSKDRIETVPLTCVKTVFGGNSMMKRVVKTDERYWLITTCPANFPKNIVWRKCRKFLPQQELNIEDINRPVHSAITKQNYQNIYCAICFGENPEKMFSWKATILAFLDAPDINLKSKDFFPELHTEEFRVLFRPPQFLSSSNRCYKGYIEKCNQTGLWPHWDERLVWACESISMTVLFASCKTPIYKNLYCALCNLPDEILPYDCDSTEIKTFQELLNTMQFKPVIRYFSALLNVGTFDVTEQYQIDKKCSHQTVYSPILKECLLVYCEDGYILQGRKCHRKFATYTLHEYSSILSVCQKNTLVEFNTIFDTIVTFFLSSPFRSHGFNIKYLRPYILRSNIVCLPFFVKVTVRKSHNYILMLNQMLATLQNFEDQIKYGNFSENIYAVFGGHYHFSPFGFYSVRLKTSFTFDINSKESSIDISTNFVHPVTFWQLCEKVILPNTYRVNQSDNIICIIDYDFCIDDKYVKIHDNSSLSICLQKYQEMTNSYTRAISNQDESEMYFSVICLSASSAGCLLTIILALVFEDPSQRPTLIKMALCFTLFLANTVYTVSGLFESYPHICIVMGMLSHFLWVSVVCWMNISCFDIYLAVTDLLYLRRDRNTSLKILFYFLINFSVSILMVALHIVLNFQKSQGSSLGYSASTCFLLQNETKLYTFGLPLGLMVALNGILFTYTHVRIRQNLYVIENRNATLLKVYLKLSTISGISWVLGFLYEYMEINFFSHTHTLLTGSQGIFILWAFGTTFKPKTSKSQSITVE